jgi:isopenicillin N synthase-like dioxygenase
VANACLSEALGVSFDDMQAAQAGKQHPCSYNPCPLDYFLYKNTPEVASICNCTEHVDRGLLHVVVASSTPGLQVLTGDGWRSIEEELVPFEDAVVFTNCMMESITTRCGQQEGGASAEESPHECARCSFRACTHRVAKEKRPRLSLSFELRLPPG